MTKTELVLSTILAAAALSTVAAAPAYTGAELNQGVVDFYDVDARTPSQNGKTTLGDAIQGGFYGNAVNPRASGHGTLPSLAPGPKVCSYDGPGGSCGTIEQGSSWGNYKNAHTDDDAAGGQLNPSNHR